MANRAVRRRHMVPFGIEWTHLCIEDDAGWFALVCTVPKTGMRRMHGLPDSLRPATLQRQLRIQRRENMTKRYGPPKKPGA